MGEERMRAQEGEEREREREHSCILGGRVHNLYMKERQGERNEKRASAPANSNSGRDRSTAVDEIVPNSYSKTIKEIRLEISQSQSKCSSLSSFF